MTFACMSVTEVGYVHECHAGTEGACTSVTEFVVLSEVHSWFMSVRDVECVHECQRRRMLS
jgi:hypothetical protein